MNYGNGNGYGNGPPAWQGGGQSGGGGFGFGAPPEPPPPPQRPPVHVCFSGSLYCSGVIPCDACLQTLMENVLTVAIAVEHQTLAAEAERAAMERRPISCQVLAEAYFATVKEAWRALHQAMAHEPPAQRRYHVVNTNHLVEAAEQWRLHSEQRETMNVQRSTSPGVPLANVMTGMRQPPPPPAVLVSEPADLARAMQAGAKDHPPPPPIVEAPPPPIEPMPHDAPPPPAHLTAEDVVATTTPFRASSS